MPAVRAQNEGGNGTTKGIGIDISDRMVRLPKGRVAQAIMLGIQLMIANLRQIEIWARDNTPSSTHIKREIPPDSLINRAPDGNS